MRLRITLLESCLGLTLVAGCGAAPSPQNIDPVESGGGYQAQYRDPPARIQPDPLLHSARMNMERCTPMLADQAGGAAKGAAPGLHALAGERLSRGDLVDLRIGDDDTFNGDYVVSRDGMLKLPFLPPVPAQGRKPEDVQDDLARLVVREGLYDSAPRISVRIDDFASASLGVSGAVFEPHAVEIGQGGPDRDQMRQQALGASTEGRNLSAAIRAAGGVRPDADLSAVQLHRAGERHVLDLRGVFEGRDAMDVMVLSGDEIIVPTRHCFQDDLMRPSPISPPGISLFLSNLTQPATGNAPSAVGRDVRQVPYGTRFMQAVVDTNCVGGARATSAHRSAVLMSRNPQTGVSTVIERNIEDQIRRPDRDDYDPYLLPGDAIACYDSSVTNLAEGVRVIGAVAGLGMALP
ncbi:polysaccharide biosynthesis/export family protein [Tropicibacter oceani]|uniref:Polysaccharide biosynthesis/export family protein n=1 Tax=Tropicibacter oceani TaxID=3058420 RepID=A0ABY8QED1_9RHOB|nr:polysaccharide biosynthesis/export family protein [Tropicibacter oceani]WGW02401.1 polysaccharide biosynthesis/export family protein [Tropicibacter oceani]